MVVVVDANPRNGSSVVVEIGRAAADVFPGAHAHFQMVSLQFGQFGAHQNMTNCA